MFRFVWEKRGENKTRKYFLVLWSPLPVQAPQAGPLTAYFTHSQSADSFPVYFRLHREKIFFSSDKCMNEFEFLLLACVIFVTEFIFPLKTGLKSVRLKRYSWILLFILEMHQLTEHETQSGRECVNASSKVLAIIGWAGAEPLSPSQFSLTKQYIRYCKREHK